MRHQTAGSSPCGQCPSPTGPSVATGPSWHPSSWHPSSCRRCSASPKSSPSSTTKRASMRGPGDFHSVCHKVLLNEVLTCCAPGCGSKSGIRQAGPFWQTEQKNKRSCSRADHHEEAAIAAVAAAREVTGARRPCSQLATWHGKGRNSTKPTGGRAGDCNLCQIQPVDCAESLKPAVASKPHFVHWTCN